MRRLNDLSNRPPRWPSLAPLALAAALVACGGGDPEPASAESSLQNGEQDTVLPTDTAPGVSTALASGSEELSPEEIEAGRQDASWRGYVDAEAVTPADTTPNPEAWEDITPSAINGQATHLPLSGDVAGPSVAAVQILLDRALYRPGVIDGRWGKNTEKAVYWLQETEGLDASGTVDRATFERLREMAGDPERLAVARELVESDVSGPFVDIPDDVYERAELECLCYESQAEQLAERFHTTPELLEQMNPDKDLMAVRAGETLWVPNVERFTSEDPADGESAFPSATGRTTAPIAKLVISDGGHYVHAVDSAGDVLYHFPSTLGADYAPSPSGDYSVDSIHQDPIWHYKPDLLSRVDPSRPDARLPPGPNNAVGIVWMQLSKDHYGIHGTSAPSTIGYATSHGCVRLTNWDAEFLSHQIDAGTPVDFIAGTGRSASR